VGASSPPTSAEDWAKTAEALKAAQAEPAPASLTAEQAKRLEEIYAEAARKAAETAAAAFTPPPVTDESAQQTPAPGQPEDVSKLLERMESLESKQQAAANALRDGELAKLGVMEKYRSYAPEVDAATPDGKLALEKWVAENPELAPGHRPQQPVADFDKLPQGGIWGVSKQDVAQELAEIERKSWRH
jgi:hypothetical protein